MKHRRPAIFLKMWLRPTQVRAVAQQRLDDARYLNDSQDNARANGAMYLGGFAVECLLKARLLEKHNWLQTTRSPESLVGEARRLWGLVYERHDLEALLVRLPELRQRLEALDQLGRPHLWRTLSEICAAWTVFAR